MAACGPTKTVGSRYVKSQTVTSTGASIVVASSDSPELAGTVLRIEPGALSTAVKITLELGTTDLVGRGTKAAGHVAIWGPPGTKFSKPVELTLPYALPAGETSDNLFVQVTEDDGSHFVVDRARLTLDEPDHLVRVNIEGFTGFQPGTSQTCTANNLCPAGQVCVNGQCKSPGCNGTTNTCACMSNADCQAGQVCANAVCQTCAATTPNGTCTGSCSANNQCPQGQLCANGQCTACNASGTQCQQTCSAGVACPAGNSCLNGICQPCSNAICAPQCGNSGQACCPTSMGTLGACNDPSLACVNGQCQANCVPGAAGCPSQCGPNQLCANGQLCVNGTCQGCTNPMGAGCSAPRPQVAARHRFASTAPARRA